MTELLNCPFCGKRFATVGGMVPWVECQDCGACGPPAAYDDQACEAWNTRAMGEPAVNLYPEEIARLCKGPSERDDFADRLKTEHGDVAIPLYFGRARELDATAAPVVVAETGNPVSEQNQSLTAPVVVGEDRALVLDTIANLERINSDLEDERLAYWIERMKQRSGLTAALAGD